MRLIALVLGVAALALSGCGEKLHVAFDPPSYSELATQCSQFQDADDFAFAELLFRDLPSAQAIAESHGYSVRSVYYDKGFAEGVIDLMAVGTRIDVQTNGGYVTQLCGIG